MCFIMDMPFVFNMDVFYVFIMDIPFVFNMDILYVFIMNMLYVFIMHIFIVVIMDVPDQRYTNKFVQYSVPQKTLTGLLCMFFEDAVIMQWNMENIWDIMVME